MKRRQRIIISVIAPCYNEEDNVREMYRRVVSTFRMLSKYDFEILYVDNCSTDKTQDRIRALAKKDRRVKGIFMTRNFKSPQPSFIAGMEYACGKAVVFLHGDIQDPPELLSKFVQKWEEGWDVVYGIRSHREGYNVAWNFFYKAFYWILRKMAYIDIPLDAGEFSLVDRVVVREILAFPEYDYYLRCLRAFVGFRQIGIPYVREARHHGRSAENISTSLYWAKTIIVNFSFKPLTWISYLGMLVTILSFLFIILNVFWVILYSSAVPGIPTVVVLVLFLGGIQLLSLSVIAEYVSKIFLEVKRRPRYIIRDTINIQRGAE